MAPPVDEEPPLPGAPPDAEAPPLPGAPPDAEAPPLPGAPPDAEAPPEAEAPPLEEPPLPFEAPPLAALPASSGLTQMSERHRRPGSHRPLGRHAPRSVPAALPEVNPELSELEHPRVTGARSAQSRRRREPTSTTLAELGDELGPGLAVIDLQLAGDVGKCGFLCWRHRRGLIHRLRCRSGDGLGMSQEPLQLV